MEAELGLDNGRVWGDMIEISQTALKRLLVERQKLIVFLARSLKEMRYISFKTGEKKLFFLSSGRGLGWIAFYCWLESRTCKF